MIWDIAGAEDHFTVPSHYVKGSEGYLLVIDGTRVETLDRGLDLVAQLDRDSAAGCRWSCWSTSAT